MARNLASICKILELNDIPNYDKVLLAKVKGWNVIVSKNDNFKVGDLVIYFEIDTKTENRPEFEFLSKRDFKIRTLKMCGTVSQGLIMPLSLLNNYGILDLENNLFIMEKKKVQIEDNKDITDYLPISKYDPQAEIEKKLAEQQEKENKNKIHKFLMKLKWYRKLYFKLNSKQKGGFPNWINKTDEERLQNLTILFNQEKENKTQFLITEKIDRTKWNFLFAKA